MASWRSASAPQQRPEGHRAVALIAAAGSGERLGAGGPKALVDIGGRPMLAWSVAAFAEAPAIGLIVIAAPPGFEREVEQVAGQSAGTTHVIVTTGGEQRGDSVGLGLAEAPVSAEIVAVHDAARPLVTPTLIAALISRLEDSPDAAGVIAAAPVSDTIKQVEEGRIVGTRARAGLWAAQTPQVFRAEALRRAHDAGGATTATDDAVLIENQGGVMLVEEAPGPNPKVTTPADLALAATLLTGR
jgi:2-C-methyl-D-erythritol 4-phosphate cytidylyltransferase